ncbi:MAG: type II toxin-antitoxin system prevent-host-death family antitoxin [Aquihabitans sp.]
MADVTIRELRNHGGDVVDRARRGERLTITRAGKPVAELVALSPAPVPLHVLRSRWALLPVVDPEALRSDIDAVIDPTL